MMPRFLMASIGPLIVFQDRHQQAQLPIIQYNKLKKKRASKKAFNLL